MAEDILRYVLKYDINFKLRQEPGIIKGWDLCCQNTSLCHTSLPGFLCNNSSLGCWKVSQWFFFSSGMIPWVWSKAFWSQCKGSSVLGIADQFLQQQLRTIQTWLIPIGIAAENDTEVLKIWLQKTLFQNQLFSMVTKVHSSLYVLTITRKSKSAGTVLL